MSSSAALARAGSLIASVPDFPVPGILFRDITPLLADAAAFRASIDAMAEPFLGMFDAVAGVEARGFLLAGAIAALTGAGLVPIRKSGRLPRPAASVAFSLEYADATIEIHDDIAPGVRLLLVDDVLATGGTLRAAQQLVARVHAEAVGTSVLMELEGLNGRALVGDVHTVFKA